MDFQDRVLNDLGEIRKTQTEQAVVLGKMQVDVAHHIHRSDVADTRLTKLENWYSKFHYLGWALFAVLGLLQKLEQIKAFLHLS